MKLVSFHLAPTANDSHYAVDLIKKQLRENHKEKLEPVLLVISTAVRMDVSRTYSTQLFPKQTSEAG